MRQIQLQFLCPGCGLKGLTPKVTPNEAIGLVRVELKLRCPACCAILSIRTTEADLEAEIVRLFISKLELMKPGAHGG